MRSPTPLVPTASGLAIGLAFMAAHVVSPGTADAATPQACPDSVTTIVANAATVPLCVTLQGNAVIIVVETTATPNSAAAAPTVNQLLPATLDAQTSTYTQRQTIRDRYRGEIDELTFNDELGDGVSVAQALADAMAAVPAPNRR